MKGGTVQITWHGADPVLSLDFHRLSGLLATGGADHDIKFWTLHQANDAPLPTATFQSSLSHHTAAVNVVRFSTAGDQLASGADGGEILLWKLTDNLEVSNAWKIAKNLRFHVKDVLDLQWSSDGTLLVSGSVDNMVIIWDTAKGSPQQVLKDHVHYVQGVALDPFGQYIASISGDRTCRIYVNKSRNSKGKFQDRNSFSCQSVLIKAEVSKQEDDASKAKVNLFHDETLPSFFRRLAWSPDGSFLLVPAGIHKFPSETVLTNTAFIISRKDLARPAVQLPGASKPVIAVRFCPVVFSPRMNVEDEPDKGPNDLGVFKLPYRLIFAVATLNSLYVYDTQSAHPLAVLAGIHYAAITDIAWSFDGKFLAVSSQDGFCTLVSFDQGELGSPLPLSELPAHITKLLMPAKDEGMVLHAKSSETPTRVTNKDSSQGRAVKKPDAKVDPTTSKKRTSLECQHQREPQEEAAMVLDREEGRRQLTECNGEPKEVVMKEQHANVCSEASIQASTEPAKYMVISRAEGEHLLGCPKKPRRIIPVAVTVSSDAPLQQARVADAGVSLHSSPKKPSCISPVAIAVNSGVLQDHTEEEEGKASSQALTNREQLLAGSLSANHVNPLAREASEINPKKPREIAPVAAGVNPPASTEQQMMETSGADVK